MLRTIVASARILVIKNDCNLIYRNFFFKYKTSLFNHIKRRDLLRPEICQAFFTNYCTQASSGDSEHKNGGVYGSLSGEEVKNITENDPILEKKLRMLVMEAEVLRQDGQKVPSTDFIKAHHWKELLTKDTKSGRRKFFTYLFSIEKKKENRQQKKELAKMKFEQYLQSKNELENDTEDKITYGLGHNTIFLRFYDTAINQQANNKLIQAMQFGQQLVIDCSYDQHMNSREQLNTAKQLMLLFAENRSHSDPFDLHYCNADVKGNLMQALHRHIPPLYEPWFPLNVHTRSYLDVFPKDKLIYMTPHCRDDLVEYDHDAVYIVGAMVDKTNNEPLSLAKAKKHDLKMKRLPLDRYLQWGAGSGKSLTLNQMVLILNDIKTTGDWKYALRHVPRRKIIQPGFNVISNDRLSLPFDKDRRKSIRVFKANNYALGKNKNERKMKKSALLEDIFMK